MTKSANQTLTKGQIDDRLAAMIAVPSDNFVEIAKAAGLDPMSSFIGGDLQGCDFAGCDLDGFDFTDADLTGASFKGARICGAIVDTNKVTDEQLSQADDYEAWLVTE